MTEQANPLEKQYAKLVHRLLFECVAFWADFSPEYAKVFERVSDITKQKRPTAYTVSRQPLCLGPDVPARPRQVLHAHFQPEPRQRCLHRAQEENRP